MEHEKRRGVSFNDRTIKMVRNMQIISTEKMSNTDIMNVHKQAFGKEKGEVISRLVGDLLKDESAKPIYSFASVENGKMVGHILFSRVTIRGASEGFTAQILAPLAVLPDYQNRGIGSLLMREGLVELREAGEHLVFVLGHPDYYPRCGFTPAGRLGFEAPYSIPEEHSGAWMVQELSSGIIGNERGKVQCADSLSRPEHWRE